MSVRQLYKIRAPSPNLTRPSKSRPQALAFSAKGFEALKNAVLALDGEGRVLRAHRQPVSRKKIYKMPA